MVSPGAQRGRCDKCGAEFIGRNHAERCTGGAAATDARHTFVECPGQDALAYRLRSTGAGAGGGELSPRARQVEVRVRQLLAMPIAEAAEQLPTLKWRLRQR
eukprot:gene5368-991_t